MLEDLAVKWLQLALDLEKQGRLIVSALMWSQLLAPGRREASTPWRLLGRRWWRWWLRGSRGRRLRGPHATIPFHDADDVLSHLHHVSFAPGAGSTRA